MEKPPELNPTRWFVRAASLRFMKAGSKGGMGWFASSQELGIPVSSCQNWSTASVSSSSYETWCVHLSHPWHWKHWLKWSWAKFFPDLCWWWVLQCEPWHLAKAPFQVELNDPLMLRSPWPPVPNIGKVDQQDLTRLHSWQGDWVGEFRRHGIRVICIDMYHTFDTCSGGFMIHGKACVFVQCIVMRPNLRKGRSEKMQVSPTHFVLTLCRKHCRKHTLRWSDKGCSAQHALWHVCTTCFLSVLFHRRQHAAPLKRQRIGGPRKTPMEGPWPANMKVPELRWICLELRKGDIFLLWSRFFFNSSSRHSCRPALHVISSISQLYTFIGYRIIL